MYISSEPVQGREFQLVQQENTELSGEHHIGVYFTKPPLLAPSHSPLKATLSEQNREFQLVQQENRQLSGEHRESNVGSLCTYQCNAPPPPSRDFVGHRRGF